MLFLSDTIVGEEFLYEVQRGDSRTRIGARFGENPVVLARENGLRFPSVLNVGITLNINNRHIVPKSDLIDGICRVHSCTVHPLMHECTVHPGLGGVHFIDRRAHEIWFIIAQHQH